MTLSGGPRALFAKSSSAICVLKMRERRLWFAVHGSIQHTFTMSSRPSIISALGCWMRIWALHLTAFGSQDQHTLDTDGWLVTPAPGCPTSAPIERAVFVHKRCIRGKFDTPRISFLPDLNLVMAECFTTEFSPPSRALILGRSQNLDVNRLCNY